MPSTETESRTCYRCHREQPRAGFITKKNGTLYGMCSQCLSEILAGAASGRRKTRLPHTTVDRICYLCQRRLPNREFTRRSNGTYFSACKECNKNVFAHRRRARLLAVGGTFTTSEWLELLGRHPACPICHRRWEDIPLPKGRRSSVSRDHIVPISRGGPNSIDNIQPLCYSCNSTKGDRQASRARRSRSSPSGLGLPKVPSR
jgi:5-methylcytosine-specific restriction endonuclease McrA